MKYLLKISALALFAAVGAFVISGINPSIATAQEAEENTEPAQVEQSNNESEDSEEQPTQEKSRFSYTAQPGDSYAKIARKAVQTYGYFEEVNLSQAQIVAAETFLTSDAGFPALSVGESVTLSEEAVKAAVERAEDLDEAAEARWERYVAFVDFNTDNVGEARE